VTEVTIDVTVGDIVSGTRHSHAACPIALASGRALGRTDISVGRAWMAAGMYRIDLPQVARDFIHEFDMGGEVEPVTFTVTIPHVTTAAGFITPDDVKVLEGVNA